MVFPAKYRRAVFEKEVDQKLRDVCLEIEKRYETSILESTIIKIGALLALGFGEAGSEIVAKNLKGSKLKLFIN